VRHHYLPDAVAIIGTVEWVFGEVDRQGGEQSRKYNVVLVRVVFVSIVHWMAFERHVLFLYSRISCSVSMFPVATWLSGRHLIPQGHVHLWRTLRSARSAERVVMRLCLH
jgi:hypothetical protein